MTPDIEDQLRRAASEVPTTRALPPEILQAIERRKHRHLAVAATVASAVVILGATGAVFLAVDHAPHDRSQQLSSGHPHKQNSAHPKPSVSTAPPFPTLPTPAPPAAAPEPTTFIGAVGAGDERLARINSSNGQIVRYLQATGSQALSIFNPTRTVAYQPTLTARTCGATWVSTNLATGAQQPAFTTLKNPDEVALSPDGTRIAYTSVGKQKTIEGPSGPVRRGCPTAVRSLIIADQSTGQQVELPLGLDRGGAAYLQFDTSGNLLALDWHNRIRVLNLAVSPNLADAIVVPRRSGCLQGAQAFQPGADDLVLEADCRHDAEIDTYSLQNGGWTLVSRKVVAHQRHSFVASFCYDASGKHLIYSVDVGETENGAVFIAGNDGDRHIADDVYQVAW